MNKLVKGAVAIVWLPIATAVHSDTLRDVYELALKNDPILKSAEATFRADSEQEIIARSAFLPQIQGSIYENDVESDREAISVTAGGGGIGGPTLTQQQTKTVTETDTEGYSVSLNQALFNMPAWFNFQSGRKLTAKAQFELEAAQQDLIVRVAEAYFNVLRARDNLEASKAEERATLRQLEQAQQRYDVGLIAITDVHEARASYDSTVVRRLTDEGNVGTAMEALQVITNQSHGPLWALSKDFPVKSPEPAQRSEWVDFALANNKQLLAAQQGSDASLEAARAARYEHLPQLSASYQYTEEELDGTTRSNPANTFATNPDSESETEVISLNLQVPIFSGGRVSAQRRRAWEQYNSAREQTTFLERDTIRATRAQHIAVATDVARVKARKQAIVSTQSALDATSAGYEVGTRNVVDVLNSQRALYASIRDYANARYDYVINLLKLKRQAGILSPQDIFDLNAYLVKSGPVSVKGGVPEAPKPRPQSNTKPASGQQRPMSF